VIKNSETGKRILRNAAYLAFGSILGKASMFIVFILVARYFGPNDFGAYTTAFNHLAILGILSILGFDMTVIREGAKNIQNVPVIQNKIFPLRFWVSIFVWFLSIISAFAIQYDQVTLKLIIIMSPIIFTGGAFNSGVIEHFTSYFKIIEKMQYATYVLLYRTFLFAGIVGSMLFFNKLSLLNLAFIVTLTSIAALLFQVKQAKFFYKQEYSLKIDFTYIKYLIKPIILFGIVSFLYGISLRFNIIMLNKLSNNIEAGYYAAAWNLVSVGTLFIASFSSSIFPNSARSIFKKTFRTKLLYGMLVGTLLFAVVCVIVVLVSKFIISTIYGNSYNQSAQILAIIIWFLPLRLLSLWGHQILESANYLMLRIFVFLVPTVIGFVINLLIIPRYGALGSAYATLLSNGLLLVFAFAAGFYVVVKDNRFEK